MKYRTKYGNQKTEYDGHKFDSKKEARRYQDLKIMEQAGAISNLKLQVRFPLTIGGILICTYVSDFTYKEGSRECVEDTKGFKTPEYKLKKKLMKAIHGIEIIES
jgi:hypothetical protein